jgi:membrane associated rhomboid family serine protease
MTLKAVPVLIVVNVFVYLAWNYSFGMVGDPRFMIHNFLVSWDGLMQGRVWTLVTSAFSHNLLWHLLINMFVLNSFGSILEQQLGTKNFLTFYFAAAIISSLGHATVSAFLLGQPDLPALGASGAVAGLILVFALLYPREKILLFGIIPVPTLWGAGLFVGLDIWGLIAQSEGGGLPIGHGAHLGGALAGILYYFLILKKRIRQAY